MQRFEALNCRDRDTTIAASTTEKIVEGLNGLYSRALQAKNGGQYNMAIVIFQQVLDNDEIKQACDAIKHRQQYWLKYCCYKNLAELHELTASHQYALEYFLLASDMDANDVYFLNKFGHIALEQQQFDLANAIFQRCLKLNANHLPSYDGILQLLCHQEDYFEAYGWSVYCHSKFPKYQRSIDVIHDARDLLKHSPLLHGAFTPAITNGAIGKRSMKPNRFPSASYNDDEFIDEPTDFTRFQHTMTTASFLAFAQMIKSIYTESSQITTHLTTKVLLNDICDINGISNDECDTIETNITKPMVGLHQISMESRSCSRPTTPIGQIFQEIIPQYFSAESVDDEVVHPPSMIRAIGQPGYLDQMKDFAGDEHIFHTTSSTLLRQFFEKLKSNEPFDTVTLVFEWLKCISKCSHIQLPIELQSLYIEIYNHLANHMDWNGVPADVAADLFRMSVLHMELSIVANVRDNSGNSSKMLRFFDDRTMYHFYRVTFLKNVLQIDCDVMLEMRLNVLHFQLAIELHDYDLAMDLLDRIQVVFVNVSANIEILQLPNQFYCPFIDPWIVTNEKVLLECLQQQKDVVPMAAYKSSGQFNDVLLILSKYQVRRFASVQLPAHIQIEVLVEGFWMTDRMEECLRWCEKGLHDSMSTWWKCTVKNQQYPDHLPQHTRFLTAYLQHLLRDNGMVINLLNGRKERLVRSMTYLFDAQYQQQQQQQQQQQPPIECLFDSAGFIETLDLMLKYDQHNYGVEQQTAVLNIIGKVSEWLIRNNIPNDGTFFMNAWNTLNFNGYHMQATVLKFNRTELIRLLAHSLFGYPNTIDEHQIGCTCKRRPIDWNGVSLLFTSFDNITNGMPELELKSLINDLLTTIPRDEQMNLSTAISQLNDFLNDTVDFPHKFIPLRSFPTAIKDIFHRIASHNGNNNNNDYYSHEQLIAMDLVINPYRFSSWHTMLNIKIGQLNALFTDTYDLTKIHVAEVKRLKNAIDACFDKCEMLNQAENTITNVDYLWCYGLHLYQFSNNCTMMTKAVAAAATPVASETAAVEPFHDFGQSPSASWNMANRVLCSYLKMQATHAIAPIQPNHKSLCYFLLGKIAEKQKLTKQSLTFYQLAERQLFDHQNDDAFLLIKLEINFRITASIYKYVAHTQHADAQVVIDKEMLSFLLHVLKRDRRRIFNDTEFAMRTPAAAAAAAASNQEGVAVTAAAGYTTRVDTVATIDENANQINEFTDKDLITEIQRLCAADFEWYLELCPNYYKAAYYLIKINLNSDDFQSRSLLLQLPRKNQQKKLSLFDIHRSRHLFKVKEPVHLASIHNVASYSKYMEKCVRILIEYLATKPNWYLEFVLAMQWSKLVRADTSAHLKCHQKQQLFTVILTQFIRSASNHAAQSNRVTAKAKHFLDFYINIYELYIDCETTIKSEHFATYSKLMIDCYRLCRAEQDDCTLEAAASTATVSTAAASTGEFQQALNFCATESSNRLKAKKPSTTKVNKPDSNPSSANNNPKKRRLSEAK
ncbi:uncharacterized protein LOC129574304 [Sitodiplosis mosellana]|uniref:uncharacterized protein LOC129574304 n=1 Tax=Sitodiplosis mosellana TaxID=263140 RepID=UPI0024441044|nr:uncharacterized protein LOC129574304 [Sitodiplosis mosellana]